VAELFSFAEAVGAPVWPAVASMLVTGAATGEVTGAGLCGPRAVGGNGCRTGGREILPGIGSFLAGRTEAGIFLLAGSAAESLAGGVGVASVLVVSSGWGIFPGFSDAEESGLEVGAGRLPPEGVSAALAWTGWAAVSGRDVCGFATDSNL
jgi:hypothetical protein